MHQEVRTFVEKVRELKPEFFDSTRVVEYGAHNINGSVRDYFDNPLSYWGVDLWAGEGVDYVGFAHEFQPPTAADVVISTEMLEHDPHWELTLKRAVDIVRIGGLVLFTCASAGRHEHGTHEHNPPDSPMTLDTYHNLIEADIREVWNIDELFSSYHFEYGPPGDLRFWGVKR